MFRIAHNIGQSDTAKPLESFERFLFDKQTYIIKIIYGNIKKNYVRIMYAGGREMTVVNNTLRYSHRMRGKRAFP